MAQFYKIGEISKLCNVSIKTLRYYEEFGLLTPVEVDIYSGYRYYSEDNVKTIYQIQVLKDLGLSLQEIKNFDNSALNSISAKIDAQIAELKQKQQFLSTISNLKGEKIMKRFINDEQVIGKWSYVASAIDKDHYNSGDYYKDKDILYKNFYFLPNGEGYWTFDRWSKGELYNGDGYIYHYTVENGKLFIEWLNPNDGSYELTLVYEQIDHNAYTRDQIMIKDDTNIEFKNDKRALGYWEVYDFIDYDEKDTYKPSDKEQNDSAAKQSCIGIKNLTINPNGSCIYEWENGFLDKISWSKGVIIDKDLSHVSEYCIKKFDGEDYLIVDWKSGDYSFGGRINGAYVYKRAE